MLGCGWNQSANNAANVNPRELIDSSVISPDLFGNSRVMPISRSEVHLQRNTLWVKPSIDVCGPLVNEGA